jgi:membrane fusion protein, multidrug efflux system
MPPDPAPILPDPDDIPPRPVRRSGRYVLLVVALVALAAAAWYWHARSTGAAQGADAVAQAGKAAKGGGRFGAAGGGRRGGDPRTVMPVTVVAAGTQDFPVYQNAIGNVTARSTVTVRPRVDGQLLRLLFTEGQMVKKGELLAEIDPRPFEVQVLQANGQLARDQAQLANARVDLERYQTLFKQDSIARQQVDTQAALVRQLEGTIEADRGVVENAKLQLSFTKITAPMAGRTGLRQVDPGNMVHQSDTSGIVVITEIQPIGVLFSIPEDRLAPVLRRMRAGDTLPVDVYGRDGNVRIESGKLVTVDNQIDPTTGTVKLKAEFPNRSGALFPNQFVNVRMEVDVLHNATVVPTAAVQRGNQGTFVYRVNDDDTVSVRVVKLGPAQGEVTVVEEGIVPGERVVTDGTDKLRDGAKIEPVAPGAAAAMDAQAARARQGARAKGGEAANGAKGGEGAGARGGPGGGGGRRRGEGVASNPPAGGNPPAGVPGPASAIPARPGGAAPAGNAPSNNGPAARSPQAPAGVRASPNG